jgi:excisionase family DNA binding protein
MHIRQPIPPAVVAGIVSMLDTYIPDISPTSFVGALRGYRSEELPSAHSLRSLSVRQVAERLSISPRTVWNLIARGQLRKIRLGCRLVRIPLEDVEALEALAC